MICWQMTDNGSEDRTKAVKAVEITGKLTAAELQIIGGQPGVDIEIGPIEEVSTGSGIVLGNAVTVHQYARIELDSDNWKQWAPKIVGTWNGLSERDRIDEVVVESEIRGGRR